MIPKQMFFIWLGEEKPLYVDFSINAYKKANPDFKINLIEYTSLQIEKRMEVSKYDHNVYNCLDYINSDKECYYTEAIKEYKLYRRRPLQILANVLRLDLLNEYGGIYVDADTFPMKPFDDDILKSNSLCAYCFNKHINTNIRRKDNNFLAVDSNKKIKQYYCSEDVAIINPYKCFSDPDWCDRRKMFFNYTLEYRQRNCEHYVEHYYDGIWLRQQYDEQKNKD
jgi:mannosyltransferase OCH1-like enzyme